MGRQPTLRSAQDGVARLLVMTGRESPDGSWVVLLYLLVCGNQRRQPVCLGMRHDDSVEGVARPLLDDGHTRNRREVDIADAHRNLMLQLHENVVRWQRDQVDFGVVFELL